MSVDSELDSGVRLPLLASPAGAQRPEPGTPQPPDTPLRLPHATEVLTERAEVGRGESREAGEGQRRRSALAGVRAGGRGGGSPRTVLVHVTWRRYSIYAREGWTYFACIEVLMSIEGNTLHHKTGLQRE